MNRGDLKNYVSVLTKISNLMVREKYQFHLCWIWFLFLLETRFLIQNLSRLSIWRAIIVEASFTLKNDDFQIPITSPIQVISSMERKKGITSRSSVTRIHGITTVSCRDSLICSALFSSNMLANPAIDCEREEIECCMINREGWQPRDACSFSPSPLFRRPFSLAFLVWRRVVRTGRPHRDPVDPLERIMEASREKKHGYCALLANQKTSPTKISRNFSPPFCSAHLVISIQAVSPSESRCFRETRVWTMD